MYYGSDGTEVDVALKTRQIVIICTSLLIAQLIVAATLGPITEILMPEWNSSTDSQRLVFTPSTRTLIAITKALLHLLGLSVLGMAIWQFFFIRRDDYKDCLHGEAGDPVLISLVGQITMLYQLCILLIVIFTLWRCTMLSYESIFETIRSEYTSRMDDDGIRSW